MWLLIYVFLVGCSITGVEMAASRFLAPYFGTSMVVWANVIGIILLALAVGYNIGGRVADRYPHKRGFYAVGATGSLLLLVLPFGAQWVLSALSGSIFSLPLGLLISSFVASLVLFGVPVFFLAMLSPYALRISELSLERVGHRAGLLSFCSTLGSILGIYLTTFLTIPMVGVRETIWLYGFLLFLPSVVQLPRKWLWATLVLLCFGITTLFYPQGRAAEGLHILHSEESVYQHIEVAERRDGSRFLLFNDGQGIQSIYHPDHLWTGLYYDYYAPLLQLDRFADHNSLHTLILGYAGGTVGKLFHQTYPGTLHTVGVEIDPVVSQLSTAFFGVLEEERTLVTMDGRQFLKQGTELYDVIVVDAYTQEIYIPAHMITREFFEEVSRRLNTDGILLFNLNAKSSDSPLFTATVATLQSAGFSVWMIPIPDSYNYIVIGSKTPLSAEFTEIEDSQMNALMTYIRQALRPLPLQESAVVFEDNHSPVDMLIHQEILSEALRLGQF